jgi:hypothetical protein
MTNPIFDYISSLALSLTISGNTGISPFLTLFLLGVIEISNPNLLNMGTTVETLLSSWWSVIILGILVLVETIGKCIPAIDSIIDSIEILIVPILSIVASIATLGLFSSSTVPSDGSDEMSDSGSGSSSESINNNFGEGFITFTKIMLVLFGIVLSLLIHFFKMLIRVSSLICSAGCCQPCITILEFCIVCIGVVFAILSPIFAIIACIVLLFAASYTIKTRFCTKKTDEDENENENENININSNSTTGVVQANTKANSVDDAIVDSGSSKNNNVTISSNNNNTCSNKNDVEQQQQSEEDNNNNIPLDNDSPQAIEVIVAVAAAESTSVVQDDTTIATSAKILEPLPSPPAPSPSQSPTTQTQK